MSQQNTSDQYIDTIVDLELRCDCLLPHPYPWEDDYKLPQYIEDLIAKLPPTNTVWRQFLSITQVPRPSNDCDKGEMHNHLNVKKYLTHLAEKMGCEYYVDKADNIIIRKPATPGYENAPTICLQGHMDMVCVRTEDCPIDPKKQSLKPRIVDDKWVMATDTSLGGDNGIGVAMCYSILEDDSFEHGPIEVLITRDEETGLYGAEGLEENILKCKFMMNIDSEEENAICIGCAGGLATDMVFPLQRVAVDSTKYTMRRFVISNLLGGHSGADINLGRANALHVMARLFKEACETFDYRIVDIECGTADNVIPHMCTMDVCYESAKEQEILSALKKSFDEFYNDNKDIEKNATFSSEERPLPSDLHPATPECSKKFINFLNCFPFGPQRVDHELNHACITSLTLAICNTHTENRDIFMTASYRSSSNIDMYAIYRKVHSLCQLAGVNISKPHGEYPGWNPETHSDLLTITKESYESVLNVTPRIYSIHAGLECGLIKNKYPEVQFVSVGPTIENAHTVKERLLIESVPKTYKVVINVIKRVARL